MTDKFLGDVCLLLAYVLGAIYLLVLHQSGKKAK